MVALTAAIFACTSEQAPLALDDFSAKPTSHAGAVISDPDVTVPVSASETARSRATPPQSVASLLEVTAGPAPRERRTSLPFTRWVVENCMTDAIAPSAYSRTWIRHPKPRGLVGPNDPKPLVNPREIPEAGSLQAEQQAIALETAWLETPRSHTVDCTFRLLPRRCKHCDRQENTLIRLMVYLPAKLFTFPEEVDSLLLLVPGGHGGRSRPFLRPIPGSTTWDSGAGGLDTKALADAFYAKSPNGTQTVIAALETSGHQHASGAIEFLTHDIEHHIRSHFLPSEQPLRLGVDGVSSGSREILRATFAKPDRFRTVGLHCMACGGVHPKKNRLGSKEELTGFAAHLAARRELGLFDLRMSIGSRDNQLPCNRGYLKIFQEGGLIKPGEESSLFHVVDGGLHDFNYLSQAWAEQLRWHLELLRQPAPGP